MKRSTSFSIIVASIAVGLWSSAPAVAEETSSGLLGDLLTSHFDRDFGASIGYKAWYNKWQTFFVRTPATLNIQQPDGSIVSIPGGDSLVTLENADHEFTSIPALSLRYKNFFVSGSYYAETSFSFPRTASTVNVNVIDVNPADPTVPLIVQSVDQRVVDLSADRSEWDVSLGYYLNPYLGITVGYKHMNQDVTTRASLVDLTGQVLATGSPVTTKFEIEGPTVGLVGSVPVFNRVGVYGNFGYGFLETKSQGARDLDSPYYVVEGGIAYSYAPEGGLGAVRALTAYAGYRTQTWTTEDVASDGREGNDTTQGFVAGLNVSF